MCFLFKLIMAHIHAHTHMHICVGHSCYIHFSKSNWVLCAIHYCWVKRIVWLVLFELKTWGLELHSLEIRTNSFYQVPTISKGCVHEQCSWKAVSKRTYKHRFWAMRTLVPILEMIICRISLEGLYKGHFNFLIYKMGGNYQMIFFQRVRPKVFDPRWLFDWGKLLFTSMACCINNWNHWCWDKQHRTWIGITSGHLLY